VRDCEFVERAHRSGDKQNDIAGAHQNNVASFQAKAGIDDQVTSIERQFVSTNVFLTVVRGRNSYMKNPSLMSSLTYPIDDSGRGTGQEQDSAFCQRQRQSAAFSASASLLLTPGASPAEPITPTVILICDF